MGATDTKSITHQIDSNFRSLRKYHDPFYGQLTLVQSKSTHQLFALIQKIIYTPDSSFQQYLILRKQHNPYLVKLNQYYSCSVDYCSSLEKYFFLVEFSEHTLYMEMTKRQERGEMWGISELWTIFANYVEILAVLKDPKSQMFKSYVSNHLILNQSQYQLKTLQPILKAQPDTYYHQFHTIKNTQSPISLYLSPQSFTLLCNKQKIQSRTTSLTEKSIVFMLGMNFLQCALLADVSGVYNQNKGCVEFDRVEKALEEVERLYGEEVFELVRGMLTESQDDRWSIQEIKEYLKLNAKRRKIITIPKHRKMEQFKVKQLRV